MLSLLLLGPVELRRQGRPVLLAVRKAQALLVLLALGGGSPRGRVAALLWPELDEATARRNLRRELARLRDQGLGDAVLAEGDRLVLAPQVELDTQAFRQALRDAGPEAALQHWRGPPADGLDLPGAADFADWLQTERERLLIAWRDALEAAAAAAEAQGRNEAALDWLDRLLADDPLQERHHRAAMRLLAAAGRREAALQRYQRCRDLLQAELGLAPMAETEALAASLRGQPAAPAPAVAPPPSLLPDRLPFVGREADVAWLERAWRDASTLLIEGEGGIGKSRLAIDFAASRGPSALVHCRPGDAELPLASFTRALRLLAGPAPALDELPEWVRVELARLLPELGPTPRPLRTDAERARFSQACAIAWRAWAAGNFDAVLVDDWHLADPASQALLLQLDSREAPRVRQLLVFRPELSDSGESLLRRYRDTGAAHLRLEPLPPTAVYELVRRLSGTARPERFAALLSRATAGLPFYLAETLRHLVDSGLLTAGVDGVWQTPFDDATVDYRELPLPASVRDAVLARVLCLPQSARRVLEAAALAAEPFAAAMLAPACALSEVEAALALESALDARLLREHEHGGLAFAHDLVQQALESSLSAERRRSVHRRLALGAAAAGAAPARVAQHHEAGGEAARAVPWRRRAGEDALRLHALDEAIQQWQRALDDGPLGDEAMIIRAALMQAHDIRGHHEAAQAEADALMRLVEAAAGSPTQRFEARIAVAALHGRRENGARALALLEPLPATAEPRLRALALRARSEAVRSLGRVEEARELAREALACGGLRDEELAQLLDSLVLTEYHAGRLHEALGYVEQSLALARAAGDSIGLARTLGRRASILSQMGDNEAAERGLVEAAGLAGRLGMVGQQRASLFNLCVVYSALSRPVEVLRVAHEAWALQPPLPQEPLRTQLQLALVEGHVALGELGEAWRWMRGAMDDALALGQLIGLVSVLHTGAELLAVLGESGCAAPIWALLNDDALRELRSTGTEMWVVQAECALMEGDTAAARRAWQRAASYDEVESDRLRARLGVVEAALRLADGDPAAALDCLPAAARPGMNDELRSRALAVQLGAEAAAGAVAPATLQAVDEALARPGVYSLAELRLHQALVQVAGTPARVDALAASLDPASAQRAQFERRWRRG